MPRREIQSTSYQTGVDKYLISPEDRVILDQLSEGFFQFGFGIHISNSIHEWQIIVKADTGDFALKSGMYDDVYPFYIEAGANHELVKLTAPDHVIINGSLDLHGDFTYLGLSFMEFVKDICKNIDWQESVLSMVTPVPGAPSEGDRYIAPATAGGWTEDYVYEYEKDEPENPASALSWHEYVPTEGFAAWVEDEDKQYIWNGTDWVWFGSTLNHNVMLGIQGGVSDTEHYHLSASEHTELTEWIDDVTLSDGGDMDLAAANLTTTGIVDTEYLTARNMVKLYASTDPNRRLTLRDVGSDWAQIYNYDDVALTYHPINIGGTPLITDGVSIAADGKVGLGTDTPTALLTLYTSAASIMDADGSGLQGRAGAMYISAFTDLIFRTSLNSEKMRILTGGNVGIGTSGPSAPLHVYHATTDTAAIFESGDANALIALKDSADVLFLINASGTLSMGSVSSLNATNLNVDVNGQVGIGITVPLQPLHIDATVPKIRLERASANYYDLGQDSGSDIFDIQYNGNPIVSVVGADGAVGINIDVPVATFDVNGTVALSNRLSNRADTTSYILFGAGTFDFIAANEKVLTLNSAAGVVVNEDGRSDVDFRIESDTYSHAFFMRASDGHIGLGTTAPDTMLHISDPTTEAIIRLEDRDTGIPGGTVIGQIQFEQQDSNSPGVSAVIQAVQESGLGETGLAFQTGAGGSPSERMRIDETGLVGIGETAPTDKLTVRGNIQLTGNANRALTAPSGYSLNLNAIGVTGDEGVFIGTNGSPKLYVVTNGNVGIGVASPDEKLEVNGNVRVDNAPTISYHLANKEYVDLRVDGLDWQESVIRFERQADVDVAIQVGDRYICDETAGDWTINYIYEWNGTSWTEIIPDEGTTCWVEGGTGGDTNYTWNGSAWVKMASTLTHNNLSGLQGGDGTGTGERYHLTNAEYGGNWGAKDWYTSTGKIGVGTSPTEALEVVGNALFGSGHTHATGRPTEYINVSANGEGESAGLYMYVNEGTQHYRGWVKLDDANSCLEIGTTYSTGPIPSIYLKDKVGIGTNSPAQKLTVHNGHIFIEKPAGAGTPNSAGQVKFGTDSGTYGAGTYAAVDGYITTGTNNIDLRLLTGYNNVVSEVVRVTASTQRVGIGTDSPAEKLHVAGNIKLSGASPSIRFDETDTTDQNWQAQIVSGRLRFGTQNDAFSSMSEQVTFLNNGNVGIGTDNPAIALNVARGGETARIYVDTYDSGSTGSDVSKLVLRRSKSDTLGTDLVTTDGDYLGIIDITGCNSSNVKDRAASIEVIQNGSSTSNAVPADMYLYTSGATAYNTNQLVLHHDGGVGIGTDSPNEKLDVAGNIAVNTNKILFEDPVGNNIVELYHGNSAGNYDYPMITSQGTDRFPQLLMVPNGTNSASYAPGYGIMNSNDPVNFGASIMMVVDNKLRFYSLASGTGQIPYLLEYDGFTEADFDDMNVHDVGSLGIGTSTADEVLHVVGSIKMVDGNEAAGSIMRSDANGVAEWADMSSIAGPWTESGGNVYTDTLTWNVGIGTASPGTKLEIENGNAAHGGLYIKSDGAAQYDPQIRLYDSGADWFISMDRNDSDKLKFLPTSGVSLTLQQDGKVGIGTDSPATKLDIALTDDILEVGLTIGNSDGQIDLGNATGTDNAFLPQILAYSKGSKPFNIVGRSADDTGTEPIVSISGNVNNGTVSTRPILEIANNTTPLAMVLANGNVGIGTTSPGGKLHVYNGASGQATPWTSADDLVVENSTVGGISVLVPDAQSGSFNVGCASDSSIGLLRANYDTKLVQVGSAMASGELALLTDATSEKVRITAAGQVGIGTSSPSTAGILTINGSLVLQNGGIIANKQNTDVDTGTEDVDTIGDTLGDACVWNYVIKKGANLRAGTVTACWDSTGDTVEYNEVHTNDIGDTSDVTLAVDIDSNNVRLRATTTSDDWEVRVVRMSI